MSNTKFSLAALDSRCGRVLSSSVPKIPKYTFRGCDQSVTSVQTSTPFIAASVNQVYTGNNMLGVATMHKSNSVPVFSAEDAVDIARMRR